MGYPRLHTGAEQKECDDKTALAQNRYKAMKNKVPEPGGPEDTERKSRCEQRVAGGVGMLVKGRGNID